MDRKLQDCQQSGIIIGKLQFAFVKMGNRLCEREAKARAFVRPARIEPPESAARFVAPLGRNTRSAVADLDADLPVSRADPDADLSPG